jgi:hypothetical protein
LKILDIEILAEWWGNCNIEGVWPEITIIKKRILNLFCEFLVCDYYDDSNHRELKKVCYQLAAKGLDSGANDMTALALFLETNNISRLNMREMGDARFIGNLCNYIEDKQREKSDWRIEFRNEHQVLYEDGLKYILLGTHF